MAKISDVISKGYKKSARSKLGLKDLTRKHKHKATEEATDDTRHKENCVGSGSKRKHEQSSPKQKSEKRIKHKNKKEKKKDIKIKRKKKKSKKKLSDEDSESEKEIQIKKKSKKKKHVKEFYESKSSGIWKISRVRKNRGETDNEAAYVKRVGSSGIHCKQSDTRGSEEGKIVMSSKIDKVSGKGGKSNKRKYEYELSDEEWQVKNTKKKKSSDDFFDECVLPKSNVKSGEKMYLLKGDNVCSYDNMVSGMECRRDVMIKHTKNENIEEKQYSSKESNEKRRLGVKYPDKSDVPEKEFTKKSKKNTGTSTKLVEGCPYYRDKSDQCTSMDDQESSVHVLKHGSEKEVRTISCYKNTDQSKLYNQMYEQERKVNEAKENFPEVSGSLSVISNSGDRNYKQYEGNTRTMDKIGKRTKRDEENCLESKRKHSDANKEGEGVEKFKLGSVILDSKENDKTETYDSGLQTKGTEDLQAWNYKNKLDKAMNKFTEAKKKENKIKIVIKIKTKPQVIDNSSVKKMFGEKDEKEQLNPDEQKYKCKEDNNLKSITGKSVRKLMHEKLNLEKKKSHSRFNADEEKVVNTDDKMDVAYTWKSKIKQTSDVVDEDFPLSTTKRTDESDLHGKSYSKELSDVSDAENFPSNTDLNIDKSHSSDKNNSESFDEDLVSKYNIKYEKMDISCSKEKEKRSELPDISDEDFEFYRRGYELKKNISGKEMYSVESKLYPFKKIEIDKSSVNILKETLPTDGKDFPVSVRKSVSPIKSVGIEDDSCSHHTIDTVTMVKEKEGQGHSEVRSELDISMSKVTDTEYSGSHHTIDTVTMVKEKESQGHSEVRSKWDISRSEVIDTEYSDEKVVVEERKCSLKGLSSEKDASEMKLGGKRKMKSLKECCEKQLDFIRNFIGGQNTAVRSKLKSADREMRCCSIERKRKQRKEQEARDELDYYIGKKRKSSESGDRYYRSDKIHKEHCSKRRKISDSSSSNSDEEYEKRNREDKYRRTYDERDKKRMQEKENRDRRYGNGHYMSPNDRDLRSSEINKDLKSPYNKETSMGYGTAFSPSYNSMSGYYNYDGNRKSSSPYYDYRNRNFGSPFSRNMFQSQGRNTDSQNSRNNESFDFSTPKSNYGSYRTSPYGGVSSLNSTISMTPDKPRFKIPTYKELTGRENKKEEDYSNDKKENFELFWRIQSPFSQFHPAKFEVRGIQYNCAEQFFMHQKALTFEDKEIAEAIMRTTVPREQKVLGRKIRNFCPKIWFAKAISVVKEGSTAKFSQNPDLKEQLFATYPKIMAEASPVDSTWGIGWAKDNELAWSRKTWRGHNFLGYALTEVRNALMEKEGRLPSQ